MNGLRIFAALVVVSGLIWMAATWIMPPDTLRRATAGAREVCNASMAGSNTIGEGLAPAIVRAFLESRNYAVEAAEPRAPGEVRVVATREDRRCTVDIRSHGSGLAFEELLAGSTQIGMSSRAIKPVEVDALKAVGAGDFAADAASAEHVIALDGIAIIVHPDNPVTTISKPDVKRAFLRQITNWRALGGGEGSLRLHARNDASGTFQFFHEQVLEKDPRWNEAAAGARRFESSSELVAAVSADPAAIGFVGVAYVTDAVKVLAVSDGGAAFPPTAVNVRAEDYPISRRLYLYVRPDTFAQNAFVSALVNHFKSADAYQLTEERGFVSLRQTAATVSLSAGGLACREGAAETEVYRIATRGGRRLTSVIRFLPNSNVSDSLARDDVARAVAQLRGPIAQGAVVRLIGHSDDAGDAAMNRRLALARANAIREAFEDLDLFGLQVETAGEMCPVADNATLAGRQANRRVEIWVLSPS